MKKKYKFWSSIIIIALLILPVVLVGFVSQREKVALAYEKDTKINELAEQKRLLDEKLEASYHFETPEHIQKLSRYYIQKYFGKDAQRVEKVMMCESGLNNTTVNKKTWDYGLYQINKHWHKERFEKMFGIPFEVGVFDWDLSSRYAKYLFDNQGLKPWVCNKLV